MICCMWLKCANGVLPFGFQAVRPNSIIHPPEISPDLGVCKRHFFENYAGQSGTANITWNLAKPSHFFGLKQNWFCLRGAYPILGTLKIMV